MRINCIIVETEPLAQDRIRGWLAKLPSVYLLPGSTTGSMPWLSCRRRPDLIFLDINIGDFSGIQLLESMKVSSQVIISTAYHEYALKGFELNVTDYLLKPYTFERFVQAVDRVQQLRAKGGGLPDRKFIFVRTEYRLEKVLLDDLAVYRGDAGLPPDPCHLAGRS